MITHVHPRAEPSESLMLIPQPRPRQGSNFHLRWSTVLPEYSTGAVKVDYKHPHPVLDPAPRLNPR